MIIDFANGKAIIDGNKYELGKFEVAIENKITNLPFNVPRIIGKKVRLKIEIIGDEKLLGMAYKFQDEQSEIYKHRNITLEL